MIMRPSASKNIPFRAAAMWNCLFLFTIWFDFYPRPFWPTGIVIACVCVCVYLCLSIFACPSDNSLRVPARITWFGQIDAKHFDQGPYCFWGWLSLTFQVKLNFISKFCLFASLLRLWNICETCKNGVSWTAPHHTWRRTYSDSFVCTPTGSCHGPWNSLLTYLRETIGVRVFARMKFLQDNLSWLPEINRTFAISSGQFLINHQLKLESQVNCC